MPNLFGLDIAGLVNSGIRDAGGVRSGTLTRRVRGVRTAESLTAGTNPTGTTHSFEGFVEVRRERRDNQVGGASTSVLTIFGASITPAIVPGINDLAELDGDTYTLTELVSRDPASAVYEFAVSAA